MYPVGGWLHLLSLPFRKASLGISRNVVLLGLTSLFTDLSSEMVVSILPAYLVLFLRLTPAQFGLLDGLYQGVAAVVQLASGVAADRWRRYKGFAIAGYGLSAACRPLLLITTAWTGIAALLALDRIGKGIRTAPRDALIAASTPPANLGAAFGIHRALDAAGAMAGPLVAFAVLAWIPDGFDLVFVASAAAAFVGLAILVLFVENGVVVRQRLPSMSPAPGIAGLVRMPRYRHLVLCASALGVTTISDAFVYLTLQREMGLSAGTIPLMYVLTSLGYLVLAAPAGRLADTVGRFAVFTAGYASLVCLSVVLLLAPGGWAPAVIVLVLLGAYYAATEGVLAALASAELPEETRATGLALLRTATAAARFTGSLTFGVIWMQWGLHASIAVFLVGLLAALPLSVRTRPEAIA